MSNDRQPRNFFPGVRQAMRTLKFGGKLDIYRHMHRLSIVALAQKVGVTPERMEDILSAKHQPRAADVIRIQNALSIYFDPEDFEEVL